MRSPFIDILTRRVLVFDGAMGTSVHAHELSLDDYQQLENCTEVINLTRPDVVEAIHCSFLEVGCDAVETNTFGGTKHVLDEFGLAERTEEINRIAAGIARRACERFTTPDKPRFVIGSIGPGYASLPTLRPDRRGTTVLESYQATRPRGLLAGGVDAILVETCQDILQAKGCNGGGQGIDAMDMDRGVPGADLLHLHRRNDFGTMLVGTESLAAAGSRPGQPIPEVKVHRDSTARPARRR